MTISDVGTKNSILSSLVTSVNVGGANSGKLVYKATATVLATLTAVTFAAPSAGSVSFTSTPSASNAATGTATTVELQTSASIVIAIFLAGEITVTGSITAGQTLTETSGTITI